MTSLFDRGMSNEILPDAEIGFIWHLHVISTGSAAGLHAQLVCCKTTRAVR
jgi:hypothetical protein